VRIVVDQLRTESAMASLHCSFVPPHRRQKRGVCEGVGDRVLKHVAVPAVKLHARVDDGAE